MPVAVPANARTGEPGPGEQAFADDAAAPPAPSAVLAWFERAVVAAVILFVSVGLVGLVAAIFGVARPVVVLPIGLLVGGALVALWGLPRVSTSAQGARPVRAWIIVAGALVILGSTAVNVRFHAQHIITNRDQGIYVNGGKWIADHGDLVVEGRGPGLDGAPGLMTNALGQQPTDAVGDDSKLEIQSMHLLHTYMAVGEWVGGNRGLFVTPALIGGLALAALFLLALRLLPGGLALAATTALACNFIWFHGARDALSEPLLLLTTFAGLWFVLVAAEDGRRARLLVGGLVLGSSLAVRLDAGVGVGAVLALAGLCAARRRAVARRAGAGGSAPADGGATGFPMYAFVVGGLLLPALIGFVDVTERSSYYFSFLEDDSVLIAAFVAAGLAAGLALIAAEAVWAHIRHRRSGLRLATARRSLARLLPAAAVAAAAVTVAIFLFAWVVRPQGDPVRADRPPEGEAAMRTIQLREGLKSDPERTYAEGSVLRLAWYMGDAAVALGGAGLAVVAYRVVRGRATDTELGLVAVAVPATVLFVYRPGIYSDQPWMMRRYLPHVIPGLLLFGGLAAASLGRVLSRWRPVGRRPQLATAAVTLAASVALVAGTFDVSWPLREVRTDAGGRAGIERLCAAMGPDAVAVLGNDISLTHLPAVRGFCDIPAARPAQEGPLPLADLVPRVERSGRTLWVVAGSSEGLRYLAPTVTDARMVPLMQTTRLIATMAKPPSEYRDVELHVWVGKVETAA